MAKKMSDDTNALNWFEIPVTDISRAVKFYETVFDISMELSNPPGFKMAIFPHAHLGKVGGALVKSGFHKPSTTGVVIYLNANPDLQLVLDRVESAGGKVLHQKALISKEVGYFGLILDTEGNSIALHSTD